MGFINYVTAIISLSLKNFPLVNGFESFFPPPIVTFLKNKINISNSWIIYKRQLCIVAIIVFTFTFSRDVICRPYWGMRIYADFWRENWGSFLIFESGNTGAVPPLCWSEINEIITYIGEWYIKWKIFKYTAGQTPFSTFVKLMIHFLLKRRTHRMKLGEVPNLTLTVHYLRHTCCIIYFCQSSRTMIRSYPVSSINIFPFLWYLFLDIE